MEAVRPQIAGQLEKEKSWWADHRAVTLSNGLRLISVARPGTPTVAVRAYVRAGSRYDAEERLPDSSRPALGLAHLTEHLLFKGTKSRSQQEIFAAVERMGGALNAGTTKEYTTLCAVMPRHDLRVALSVVAELLTEPALREADVWNEKLVVLEEIRRARDQQGVIHDLFSQTLWKAHPFRHPVHGTLEALGELDREALVAFHRRRYVTGSTVLVVCGDVDHQEVCQLADEAFGSLPAGPEQLPAPVEEDLSRGILEAIDMDSYKSEKKKTIRIQLPDEDAEIGPVPTSAGGHKPEPELDRLSNIIKAFNEQFGNIPWTDADRVHRLITEEIPTRVAADTAYSNARKHSDKQNARIEHDKALARVMTALLQDDTELFKQFSDNQGFRKWLCDTVFGMTYENLDAAG